MTLDAAATTVCVNSTQVHVNPTQVYVNPTQVYVNPTQVVAAGLAAARAFFADEPSAAKNALRCKSFQGYTTPTPVRTAFATYSVCTREWTGVRCKSCDS